MARGLDGPLQKAQKMRLCHCGIHCKVPKLIPLSTYYDHQKLVPVPHRYLAATVEFEEMFGPQQESSTEHEAAGSKHRRDASEPTHQDGSGTLKRYRASGDDMVSAKLSTVFRYHRG